MTPPAHVRAMDIIRSDDADDRGRAALFKLIDSYNDAQTGLTGPSRKLALLVHNAAGEIRGGLRAISYYGWMFVEFLVLSEELRHAGIGTRLMRAAEAEARELGLHGIWLDTFSFQARPFYERLGYRVFGQIDDYPLGGARFFMSKHLALPGQPSFPDQPLDDRPAVGDNPPS